MRTETHEDQATGDIYLLLKRDHEGVIELLDEIEGTEETDERSRQDLFERLVAMIEAHSQAEEDTFYSVLEQYDDLADRVDELRQEHDDIDQSLEELDELSVGNPDWIDKMHELRQIFQHHVEQEEGEIFPRARRHIGPDEAVHLAREFRRAKQLVQEDVSGEEPLTEEEELAAETGEVGEAEEVDETEEEVEEIEEAQGEEEARPGAAAAGGAQQEQRGAHDPPLRDDIEQLSKKELYELARQRRIEGRSAMTKAELVRAIRAAK